jgi:glycosyltransferase involved in cell wall biosynthesis
MASIGLLHFTAPPVIGGVERIVRRHALLMADDGHRVRIVAGRGASPRDDIEFSRIERADSRHPDVAALRKDLAAGHRPRRFGRAVSDLADELEAATAGCDLVIAHNVASLDMNLALTSALRRVADRHPHRVILWHHDLAWARPADRHRLHAGRPWSLLRSAWPGTLAVTISEARRTELARISKLTASAITVVPNGIDLPAPADEALPDGLAALAVEADPLLLLPARLSPRKNVEVALRIVAAMREAGRNAALIVTGPVDPHERHATGSDYLEHLLELRAALGLDGAAWIAASTDADVLSDAAIEALYGLADALILPSRDEGFGLPVLEAAMRRLPIVCSDLPALRQLAGDAATYIDPQADPAALAAAILERLDGDPVGVLAGRVRRDRSWPAVYERHIAPLIDQALSAAARP